MDAQRQKSAFRRVGDLLRSQLTRANDLMVRWSMEAFMVLLPGANLENSKAIADAMLNGVRALRFEHDASPHGILTVSIGVTVSNLVSLAGPDAAATAGGTGGFREPGGRQELRHRKPGPVAHGRSASRARQARGADGCGES